MYESPVFEDRRHAGRELADHLERYRDQNPLVLGLPRGGVVLGFEIARALDAPLDVVVARKVGAPGHPELGIGAVAPGVTLADRQTLRTLGVTDAQFETLAETAREEMRRRLQEYRDEPDLPDVKGRTVILVDDGLATGVTAKAAIVAVRQREPKALVLAVAVCARETAEALEPDLDDLVCVAMPDIFRAVGLWYESFEQNTDEEVLDLLARARRREW